MTEFTVSLRRAALILAPFSTLPSDGGALHRDGAGHAPPVNHVYAPLAARWWATLTAFSELVCGQDAPLSPRQIAYLRRHLSGGMGSLNELCLNESWFGAAAKAANAELRKVRRTMIESFLSLTGSP
jgi:hypothetical protein